MGGSVVLNCRGRRYAEIKDRLQTEYQDIYYPQDAIVMEKNSRDFSERIHKANENAIAVVELLRSHPLVAKVCFPLGHESQSIYDRYRREQGGYGFLLSVLFTKPQCAEVFHDALHTAKGPSLGTNFTLTCAYTLLAHYCELEWAADYGVDEHIVRISVGVEDKNALLAVVKDALKCVEEKIPCKKDGR